jgi:hypothetical protein
MEAGWLIGIPDLLNWCHSINKWREQVNDRLSDKALLIREADSPL